MAVKVLVVDDSSFFRRRVSEIINNSPALEVIGTANNGQEAIDMVDKLKPDVVTMDIEMPVMDGITAVKKIMAANPVPILMFSSLTHQGASATLDALEAGACDFLPKKFEDIARNKEEAISYYSNVLKRLHHEEYLEFLLAEHLPIHLQTATDPHLSAVQKLNESNMHQSSVAAKAPLPVARKITNDCLC